MGLMVMKTSSIDSAAMFLKLEPNATMAIDWGQAQHDAADERSGRIAETADDGCDETADRKRHPHIEGGELRRRDQHTRNGAEAR